MRNCFPKSTSGAPLHTLSKLYDVPVGFVSPFFLGSVLLNLQSPKGGCCSISDDLSWSTIDQLQWVPNRQEFSTILWSWYWTFLLPDYIHFHWTIARVVLYQQEMSTLQDTWFRPFFGLPKLDVIFCLEYSSVHVWYFPLMIFAEISSLY